MSWGVLVWFIDDMELLNICATLGTDSINCTQNAACALLATETAGAVSMIDHIDELERKRATPKETSKMETPQRNISTQI